MQILIKNRKRENLASTILFFLEKAHHSRESRTAFLYLVFDIRRDDTLYILYAEMSELLDKYWQLL